MDAAVIRLQLPAGAPFHAAFDDAADKYSARRGFDDGGALFTKLTSAAVRAVASSSPAMIELIARERTGQIVARVSGQNPASSIDAEAADAMMAAATELSSPPTCDTSGAVIEFSLPLG